MQEAFLRYVYEGGAVVDWHMPTIDNASADQGILIKVFLVSGNRLLREALSKVLSRRQDLRVLACMACGPELVTSVAECQPDVIAIEAQLLSRDGWETILAILHSRPAPRMLAFGMDSDASSFLNGVRAGIAGYVTQDASAAEICSAVRTVACGGAVCPPKFYRILFEEIAGTSPNPSRAVANRPGVSRRQRQILELVNVGLGNKEIAAELRLSEQTVKNHMLRVFRQLGVGDRLEAVELCRDRGWFRVAGRSAPAQQPHRGASALEI